MQWTLMTLTSHRQSFKKEGGKETIKKRCETRFLPISFLCHLIHAIWDEEMHNLYCRGLLKKKKKKADSGTARFEPNQKGYGVAEGEV